MPRFFVDQDLTSPDLIDLDESDLRPIVAIYETADGFEIERTVFDFTLSIVGPRTANNRIHTQRIRKSTIDGFVENILKPGKRCREVQVADYERIRERLFLKSDYLRKKKRREQVLTESVD